MEVRDKDDEECTNASAQLQSHMQNIFSDQLDILVAIYLDDILIFSKNSKEYWQVVRKVLWRLQKSGKENIIEITKKWTVCKRIKMWICGIFGNDGFIKGTRDVPG